MPTSSLEIKNTSTGSVLLSSDSPSLIDMIRHFYEKSGVKYRRNTCSTKRQLQRALGSSVVLLEASLYEKVSKFWRLTH